MLDYNMIECQFRQLQVLIEIRVYVSSSEEHFRSLKSLALSSLKQRRNDKVKV